MIDTTCGLCGQAGEGGGFFIFRLFKSILFLLIEFHCNFSISYKRITYYVYYYCILIR